MFHPLIPDRGPLSKYYGFTIVELLIVIVVIGILAAITIVAYNGIQQRALTSILQNDLGNAARSLEQARIDNGDVYPTTFPAGFKTDGRVSLNLANTGSNSSYCINGTVQGVAQAWSYDSTGGGLKLGSCAGQVIAGSDVGGSGTKVNYVANPDFTSGWSLSRSAGSITPTVRSGTTDDPAGNRPVLVMQNTASASIWSFIGGTMNATPITAGTTYTVSYWARTINGSPVTMGAAGVQAGNATNKVLSTGSVVPVTTTWQQFSRTSSALMNGRSDSMFYIPVTAADLNQNVTIELQDVRVEVQ